MRDSALFIVSSPDERKCAAGRGYAIPSHSMAGMRVHGRLPKVVSTDLRLDVHSHTPRIRRRCGGLGADTLIAKRQNDGGTACEIDGREDKILTLIAVAYGHPVSPGVIANVRR